MQISSTVPPQYKEINIVDYLAQRFTYFNAAEWRQRVEEGLVRCNGRPCTPASRIRRGQLVSYQMKHFVPPEANFNYRIVYEDDWLLGVNKPADLRVHGRGKFVQANLVYHLRAVHHPPYPDVQLVNRLDADTSGLVLFAKDKETLRGVQAQFREHTVRKVYLALVDRVPEPAAGVIDSPIGRLPGLKGVYRFGAGGEKEKEARTSYTVLESFAEEFALVQLQPQTGRTHQLRVHMAQIGHPLVGDRLYQSSDEAFLAWAGGGKPQEEWLLNRHALHCLENRFIHPRTDREISIEARLESPAAADFAALLAQLRADY